MPIDPVSGIALGMQAVGAIGKTMGIGNKMQVKQQARLNAEQVKSQMQLADYQQQKQMDMWNATNYEAQVGHLKAAGLNPALLYGKGGGGGTTTGGAMATGVTGGTAEAPSHAMDGIQGMGIMPAQIELIRAQTENVKADTAKKAGVDTELAGMQAQSLAQGIENSKQQQMLTAVQTRLAGMQESITGATMADVIDRVAFETERAGAELTSALNEAYISGETKQSKITIFREEAIGAGLKNILTKAQTEKELSGIEVNEATIKQIAQNVAQGWAHLAQGDQKLAIEKFQAEMQQNFPNIMNVAGRQLDDWISTIWSIVGGNRPQYKNVEKR